MAYLPYYLKMPLSARASRVLQVSSEPVSLESLIEQLNARFQFLASKYPACMEEIQKTISEIETYLSTYTAKVDNLELRVQELENNNNEEVFKVKEIVSVVNELCKKLDNMAIGESLISIRDPNEKYINEIELKKNGMISFDVADSSIMSPEIILSNEANGFHSPVTESLNMQENLNKNTGMQRKKSQKIDNKVSNTNGKRELELYSLISQISHPIFGTKSSLRKFSNSKKKQKGIGSKHSNKNLENFCIVDTVSGTVMKEHTWSPRRMLNKKSRLSQPSSSNVKGYLEERRSFNALRD